MPTASRSSGAGRQPEQRRPVAIDLFSGAGGLSLGLEQAGFDVLAAVEYDPVHAATHEFNFPRTKVLCADVSAPLTAEALLEAARAGFARHRSGAEPWDGQLDLIAGGPPCQGFSSIGKRLIDDSRNKLVFHFLRLIEELRPRYFVMENVPGMAKGGHASILESLIGDFEGLGYRFPAPDPFQILNAADFGVPQERHRLFLIGTRDDQKVVADAPSPTVVPVFKRWRSPLPHEPAPDGPTVADAIDDLPNLSRFSSLLQSDEVQLSDEALAAVEGEASAYARRLRGTADDPDDLSYPRSWDPSMLTSSMRTVHTPASVARFSATQPGDTEPVSRFYRLDPRGLCNTLRAGSGSERGAFTSPRPLHPTYPRVLSNREAARLHSFPDWFRVHTTKWHGFRQIGNAVAPLVGRAVGRAVVSALAADPPKPAEELELGSLHLIQQTMSEAIAYFDVERTSAPPPRQRGAHASPRSQKKRKALRDAVA